MLMIGVLSIIIAFSLGSNVGDKNINMSVNPKPELYKDIGNDFNNKVDYLLKYINNFISERNDTVAYIKKGSLGPKIYHTKGFIMSMDSLRRTGVCTYTVDPVHRSITHDYKVGTRLLYIAFQQLEFLGRNQTASIKVNNNSFHARFTLASSPGNNCNITVEDLAFERLDGIEMGSSQAKYDSAEVENYFKETIFPGVNNYIKSYRPAFQYYLKEWCMLQPNIELENMFDLFVQQFKN